MPKREALKGQPPPVWLEDYAEKLGEVKFLRGRAAGCEEAASLLERRFEYEAGLLRARSQVYEALADNIEQSWERNR